jgi:HD-like signal output (HDOD) protein
MTYPLLGLLGFLMVLGLVVVFLRKSPSRRPALRAPDEAATPTRATAPTGAASAPGFAGAPLLIPTRWVIPDDLARFQRKEAFELSADEHRDLVALLARIPRPPQGLQRLLSPEFLEHVTSGALSDLILAEPHLAGKVLARVNSPFHGLKKPETSVEQSINLLGLNTVRTICLQCLMNESLRPGDPRLKPVFDRWWHASAIGSQLCLKLGPRVGVSDPGSMATLVVLSFLGHMVALSLSPPEATLRHAALGFLERTRLEQELLGLCAGELGCLMMNEWAMPPAIVEDVREIDRVLTTAPKQLDAERGLRLALGYYCARVAEKLASGEWTDLESAMPETLQGAEFYHLQTHFMIRPRMTELALDFRDPAFVSEVQAMVQAVRGA